MKIKSVRFLNLNSLRGEHEINFDAPPLSDSGLFAITGPTGAGKTTILDAITLGLYGKVNRHDRDLPSEIMTRHTAEAYSEVTFEARKEVYRAKWSVYRSRKKADGNLQPIKMELCRVSDEVFFDLKSNEVPGKISELCGLDYNQFLRSVMLSQGEFTRFLKATENERSELLERITDTGIYSDISREAYRKAAAEKIALNQLRNELSGQQLLGPEMLAEYEVSLENLRLQEQQLKTTRTETEKQIAWLQNLNKLTEKENQTRRALLELEENAGKYEANFARLEQHKVALTFRPDLVKLESEQSFLTALQNQKNQILISLPELQTAVENSKKQAEAAKAAQEIAEKTLKEISPLLDDVLQKDTEIESLRRQFQKNREAYQVAKTVFDNGVAEVETNRKTVANLAKNQTDLQNWLAAHSAEKELSSELNIFERYLTDLNKIIADGQKWKKEKTTASETIEKANQQLLNAGTRLAKLEGEKQNLQAEITGNQEELKNALAGISETVLENNVQELPVQIVQLEKLRQLTRQYQTASEKIETLTSQKNSAAEKLLQVEKKQTELLTQLQTAQELLQQYQEIAEFQVKVQNYEEARKHLQPDCECPLCGALEHPFAKGYIPKLTDAAAKRNAQQKTVAELEENRARLTSEIAVLLAGITSTKITLAENELIIKNLEAEFLEQNLSLNTAFSITEPLPVSETISRMQTELLAKKLQLEKLKTAKEQARIFTEKQYRLQEETLQETSAKERASDSKKTAEIALQNTEAELLDLQEQFNQIAAEAGSFCMRFGHSFSPENGRTILSELQQRAQTFLAQTTLYQLTQLALTEAEGKLQKSEAMQSQQQKQLDNLEQHLRSEHKELQSLKAAREAIFGQKKPIEERDLLTQACEQQKQVAETARIILQTQTEKLNFSQSQFEKLVFDEQQTAEKTGLLRTALEEKLAGKSINSISDLTRLFLTDEEAAQLINLQTQLDKLLTETRQTLADTISEIKAEASKNLTSETVAFLTENLLATDLKISQLNQEIGSIAQILKRETELQEKHKELAERISNQQKEATRWEKLSELIGSDNGKKFSKFAQGLTLAKLVHLANRHLLKLNDRYQLQKAPNADLELQMIDTYQADAIRSVNTLSGGESFLVSLALALGLSDLASHKTQIDSLFIDEGFGTLDAETLDVAITALENLQASGKMIGIISHVEALKERIGTQIKVKQLSGGISKIVVSSNSYEPEFA